MVVTGLEFWPDTSNTTSPKETWHSGTTRIKLSVPKFRFDGIDLVKLVLHNELSVSHAVIWHGKLQIVSQQADGSKGREKKPMLKKLVAQTIDIIDPDIRIQSFDKNNDHFDCRLNGGRAILKKWLLLPGKTDSSRLLGARSVIIDSSAFAYVKASKLYQFQATAVYFNSDAQKLRLHHLATRPIVDKATFYRILGHRATIWNTHSTLAEFTGFNWRQLVCSNTLSVSRIDVTGPRIDLYFSYLIHSRPSNMVSSDPPRVFLQSPLKVNIGSINVNKGHLKYTELNEKSLRHGSIFIDNISAHGTNLTNISSIIAKQSEFKAHAEGTLLRRSKMALTLKLSLADIKGNYTLEGHAKGISAQQIRETAEAMSLLRVDSLQVQKIDFYIMGNQDYSRATLHMIYSGFKGEMLKAKDPPVLKTKHITSLIANTFFIYKENPEEGKPARVANTYLQRDVTSPYLSPIIKNLKVAAKEIIIKHPGLVATITNDKDLKSQDSLTNDKDVKKKKGNFFQRLFKRKHLKENE